MGGYLVLCVFAFKYVKKVVCWEDVSFDAVEWDIWPLPSPQLQFLDSPILEFRTQHGQRTVRILIGIECLYSAFLFS